jgi:hypothetical protein
MRIVSVPPSLHLNGKTSKLATWSMLLALASCGCAGFWDEVTSRNRDLKGYFRPPDPMVTIAKNPDGAKRALALAELREPTAAGDTPEQKEIYFKILTTAALNDPDQLCRLGAIRALGKCKNPRGVHILEDVIQQKLPFEPDINSVIRQQALSSLEETELPEARTWLIRVARQPNATGTFQDQQQILDERLAALRGLGKFKQSDATETLLNVLETEKDVALRDRAHQSLQQATGKRLPPEAVAWRDFLHGSNTEPYREPNPIQRAVNWVEDWFH